MRYFATPLLLLILGAAEVLSQPDFLAEGKAAWQRRSEDRRGDLVTPAAIDEAIAAFERCLTHEPVNLEVHWRLMQALYFKSEYTPVQAKDRLGLFEHGREVFDSAVRQLAHEAGGCSQLERMDPEAVGHALRDTEHAAALYFWGAVHWGKWGESVGKLSAARQGVAGRLRRYSQIVIALDESYEDAGGHRMLGRLHTEAPKIPLITGWVDRDRAVRELERAVEIAPGNLENRLFLAEALLEFRPAERSRAVELVQELTVQQPHPERLVEEERILVVAKALLERIDPRHAAVE